MYKLIALLTLFLIYSSISFGQIRSVDDLQYEVQMVYPYISISKEELLCAESLSDLNNETNSLNLEYSASWIEEYRSVEITAYHKGERTVVSQSKTEVLSQAQKNLMLGADTGSEISVNINYIPNNKLSVKEEKELMFSFVINPEFQATFPQGQQALNSYLLENVLSEIPDGSYGGYDMSAIKFDITTGGKVVNARIFGSEYQSASVEKLSQKLLAGVEKMPCWQPARYSDGTYVQQEYVLTVGSMESCVASFINIDRDAEF